METITYQRKKKQADQREDKLKDPELKHEFKNVEVSDIQGFWKITFSQTL